MQRRWGTWGILIFMLWALVLAFLAAANLLLLAEVAGFYSSEPGRQNQIWLIFSLNALFCLGFVGSVYGLWTRRNWGRLLFLWLIVIWSSFQLMAIFTPGFLSAVANQISGAPPAEATTDRSASFYLLTGLRFGIGLLAPLWYLNLPRIKTFFEPEADKNFGDEDSESG